MTTYPFTRSNVDDTVNRVYEYIVDYIRDKGYPPAVRDICAGVGIRSTSTIHSHLQRLQNQGKIVYSSGKRRAITIPEQESNRVVSLPLVGEVTAGMPIFAQENVIDHIPRIPGIPGDFCLKTKGKSMEPIIMDKSIVIVKKEKNLKRGTVGVFIIRNNECVVKRFFPDSFGVVLQSENANFEPIVINKKIWETDCMIVGRVTKVILDVI